MCTRLDALFRSNKKEKYNKELGTNQKLKKTKNKDVFGRAF